MSYVVSISDEDGRKFYFAGWDGSDTQPDAGELTFWRPTVEDPETYMYSDFQEVEIEARLIVQSKLAFALGLPEEFVGGITKIRVEQMKVGSHGKR